MKRVAPWLCGILLACTALLFSQTAEATHFRYGNVTWRLPDPTNAPLTVEFTVTVGWRSTFVDQTQLNFGDATNAPFQLGTQIGGGIDATGAAYSIYQYQVTHTYASPGVYTAFFQGGDRISTLINAADDLYRIESTVALDATGTNTSGPISGIPVIIQFEVNSLNQFVLPVFDPDADPHTCRFSTAAESGIQGTHPPQLPPCCQRLSVATPCTSSPPAAASSGTTPASSAHPSVTATR